MSDHQPPVEVRPISVMNRVVTTALSQPFLVILMTIILIVVGTRSLNRLPVDAYPDLSPPNVEIITQWPGHAAEEVERLITVPVELGMNGIPKTANIRSISLYGLSDVILTFDDGTDNYFARHLAHWNHAVSVADGGTLRADLPLCAAKPRPLANGAEDLRSLDHRAAISLGARRGK
jgi:hypothetical protein